MRLFSAGAVVFLCLVGCQQPAASVGISPSGAESGGSQSVEVSEADAEILETVFRDLLRDRPGSDVHFLSLGYRDDLGGWLEAPETLLRRLADLNLDLRKPSEARVPQPFEMEDRRPTPIRERTSGRRGSVYWVRITKRLSDTEVEVEGGRVGGMLDGSGYWAVVRREGYGWVLDKSPGGRSRGWEA